MVEKRRQFAFVLLLAIIIHAGFSSAATINAASCSQSAVQTAINAAANGDTIMVPAGSCSWSAPPELPNTKGLTIMGAGIGNTILTQSDTWIAECSTGRPHRITGFTFRGTPSGGMHITLVGTCRNFRIDHNRFENVPEGYEAISINAGVMLNGPLYGLIDNNVFTTTGTNFRAINMLGNIDYGVRKDWQNVTHLGMADNIYIEDNVFFYANGNDAGSGTTDGNSEAAFVFRFNNMTNSNGITSHGVCNSEGIANQEAYMNNLISTAANAYPSGTRLIHQQGSGEAMYFGNRFTASGTKSTEAINIQHYRSGDAGSAGCGLYPRCNGNAANAGFDGNRQPTATYYGYPCRYQPGRRGGNMLSPIYGWDNKWSDTLANVAINIENNWPGPPLATDHIKPNRDYYDYTPSFTGATGVGVGTLAQRPATCTTNPNEQGGGVGYWATDVGEWNSRNPGPDGQLYRCSATNTWTLHYIPYPYPHPLQGQAPADAVPPTVSITSPAGGQVSGTITITATASDNVGVVGVQFKLDGANIEAEDVSAPYSISYNTASASNGAHTLTATARDASGNTATSAGVSITISNVDTTPPTISGGSPTGALAAGTT